MRRTKAEIKSIIKSSADILREYHPMTLRQVFYQLVSKHIIKNTLGEYKKLSDYLVSARQDGLIPWDWIEDRTRYPRSLVI